MLEISFLARDRIVVRSTERPHTIWRSCDPASSDIITKVNNSFYLRNRITFIAPMTYRGVLKGQLKYHHQQPECNILLYSLTNYWRRQSHIITTELEATANIRELYIPHILANGKGLWCCSYNSILSSEVHGLTESKYSSRTNLRLFKTIIVNENGITKDLW